ncbi:branched-chain amino acid transport system II carrier protein [Alkalicoccobacillus plakortidis]|uniref:Branched-chain amino acid transport system carrier protein n=1 Tax=Alkalicoccobacillus plakortidis TaxID=444060 RepID=A0ABT0XE40_9BACI|nr:branched-chain amino acid transport system II carrier protein [Alkalicoccobacillus plakortidis]MCM2674166.1 branched-chain amino acid transport system II carrier protein [Alkalicoccobacillus plakortidis]
MSNRVPASFTVVIGLMLFALFFGAGNLIFPAMLGQSAGESVWVANAGFLVTGVGLPLLGVLAFGFSGKEDLQALASRIHPTFALIFTTILYLSIGPFFAIPRTGGVSFEVGVKPYLPENMDNVGLLVFTILFFALTCLISLNPDKIIDIVGKILTPIKLLFIGILVVIAIVNPLGDFQSPVGPYVTQPFFKGFQEGYLTMDTLASFVFGIMIIQAIKQKGANTKKQLMSVCLKAAGIAAIILVILYTSFSYLGASSVENIGYADNGGTVLAQVSAIYFGQYGSLLLGLMITIACLTTSVGLITSCATYFHKLMPRLSYKMFAILLSAFSVIVANVGLTQLISISVPVMTVIYPVAIVLIFLTFLHPLFKGSRFVYQGTIVMTLIVSFFEGLEEAGLSISFIHQFFGSFLPFYDIGLGWILPAIVGGCLGYLVSIMVNEQEKVVES